MILAEIPNKKNLKLIIREYTHKDSNNLIRLEDKASQLPFTLFGLLGIGKIFGSPFEYKCKKYKDCIMLVAEHVQENGDDRICAGASLGIKDIYFNKQKVRAGYLFDLRVSEDYQRLGIGQSISKQLEEMAKAKGVEMLFLGVNSANNKAISLYEKMGFVTISKRGIWGEAIKISPIRPPLESKSIIFEGKNLTMLFRKATRDEALEYLGKFYSNQDLALQDFGELVDSEAFEGTYIAETEDGDEVVGVSLTQVGNENVIGLKKFFIQAHHYLNPIIGCFIFAIFLSFFMPLIFRIQSSLRTSISNDNQLADFLTSVIFLIIAWVMAIIFSKLSDLIRVFSGYESRGRIIAPFQFGEKKYSKALFQYLKEEVHGVCRTRNIRNVRFNIDSNDKIWNAWRNSDRLEKLRGGLFMAKTLTSTFLLNPRTKSDIMYFDNRDF